MLNLIKSDLKRMLKDKLFLISCIIGLGFAIFTPLMYKGLSILIGEDAEYLINSKTLLATCFAPMSNFCLIFTVFIAIIISKDFSYGTFRNKIIVGKSRNQVYLSTLISSLILIIGSILIYTIVNFGLSCLLLDYSIDKTATEDIGYILLTILFGLLSYVFIGTLVNFFCMNSKNAGTSIVFYFGIAFLLTIIATITSLGKDFIDKSEKTTVYNLLEFLSNINIFYHLNFSIGLIDTYSTKVIIYIIIDSIVFGSLITYLGIVIFNKKDLK